MTSHFDWCPDFELAEADAEQQRHVFDELQRRDDWLLAKRPWLLPGPNLWSAELAAAATEAANLAAEREAMALVLSDISPSISTGVRTLSFILDVMGTRLLEVTEAADSEGVARPSGMLSVFVTTGSAAVETPERLGSALRCGIDTLALANSCAAQEAAGASGSVQVVQRLQQLSMRVSHQAMRGAIRARRTNLLFELPALAAERSLPLTLDAWAQAASAVIGAGRDVAQQKALLIWLSQRVRPWPVWWRTFLCYAAAEAGHLAILQYLMHDD
ncbi:hypothetical protein JKP88DRAFT_353588 [Tribonema minus]|uniref:Uncharacterized protein n=1 Tax=Tribonema minus TaxID=303371 RepID=A0A836CJP2_9STRA|nr:hypothetical protein JKP88DRAFT_353588 [Tribonema minus]